MVIEVEEEEDFEADEEADEVDTATLARPQKCKRWVALCMPSKERCCVPAQMRSLCPTSTPRSSELRANPFMMK